MGGLRVELVSVGETCGHKEDMEGGLMMMI